MPISPASSACWAPPTRTSPTCFEVSRSTIDNWLASHPEFADGGAGRAATSPTPTWSPTRCSRRAMGFTVETTKSVLHRGESRRCRTRLLLPARRPGLHLLAAQPPPQAVAGGSDRTSARRRGPSRELEEASERSRRRAGCPCRADTERDARSATIGALPPRSRWASSASPSPGAGPARRSPARAGPEAWQRDVLEQLGEGLLASRRTRPMRLAVASGHGIGKSALVAWIILWAMSTLHDTRGIVTANTEGQLRTKTWPELAKWHRLAVNRDWFTYTATALALGRARPRAHLAGRRHHLVGAEHRGDRRPAQQGPPRLRPVRRGLGHPRPGVGDDRGRADRCRHRAVLGGVRQSRRAAPAASANASPAAASPIAGAPRQIDSRSVGDDQQGADRRAG